MVLSSWLSSRTRFYKRSLSQPLWQWLGTLTNVFITTTYAYAISRSTFKYRKFFTVFALLSMLFNAGLVPGYIVVTQLLHLGDTIWALIVPMLLSPFNIMLMRSFFKKTIPEAILESARIDGASEARIFFQICLPLSLPGIATITLWQHLDSGTTGSMPYFTSRVITCIHVVFEFAWANIAMDTSCHSWCKVEH